MIVWRRTCPERPTEGRESNGYSCPRESRLAPPQQIYRNHFVPNLLSPLPTSAGGFSPKNTRAQQKIIGRDGGANKSQGQAKRPRLARGLLAFAGEGPIRLRSGQVRAAQISCRASARADGRGRPPLHEQTKSLLTTKLRGEVAEAAFSPPFSAALGRTSLS
jgi:hypothetical protein